MTKYILHGGMTSVLNIHNKKFYQEMFKAAKNKPILACYYSRPEKIWQELLVSDRKRMKKSVGKKKFEFMLASKNAKEFLKQLSAAEAIYFRGGKTWKLMKRLKSIQGKLKKAFSKKTVIGSSAGVYFLSKYYYSNSSNKLYEGFGIMSIKTYCHYHNKENKKNLEKLKNYKQKLPTYAIPETEFIIFKK